ncbi:MAG: asparaginase [Planctomycetota bacterium]
MATRPRVALVHTGGTLGMDASGRPLTPQALREQLSDLTDLTKMADLDVQVFTNIDSSDATPKLWQDLARKVDGLLPKVAGVIVVHGTDTMAWSATALGLMMRGLPKPVVFTGSQRPLGALRSDAPRNLLNAAELCLTGPQDVMVVFGDRVLRGVACTKDSIFHFDAFRSNNAEDVGRIGLEVKLDTRPRKGPRRYWLDTRLSTKIGVMPLVPGMDPALGLAWLDAGIEGLILEGFGAGNIPLGEVPFTGLLEEARRRGVRVVMGTQCRHGRVDPELYAGARAAREGGAAFAYGMTREAQQVKLMALLGRGISPGKFRREFETDWVGEIPGEVRG